MTNDRHFGNILKRIEDEALFLKTATIRTPAQIPLTTKKISVSIPLRLWGEDDGSIETFAASSQRAIITINSQDTPSTLTKFYLATSLDDLERREITLGKFSTTDGSQCCLVRVYGNSSDISTLEGGGSVSVSLEIETVSTSAFTQSVSYEQDRWWG